MFRLLCMMCLSVGVISAAINRPKPLTAKTISYGINDFVEMKCSNAPWVEKATFFLADTGFTDACDDYQEIDLRSQIDKYCQRHPTEPCSFSIQDVFGEEPDPYCVNAFEMGYFCKEVVNGWPVLSNPPA